jgi:hypothetical protein
MMFQPTAGFGFPCLSGSIFSIRLYNLSPGDGCGGDVTFNRWQGFKQRLGHALDQAFHHHRL